VGFRHFTLQKANQLNLNGIVKNHFDGSVKVIVEGKKDSIDIFIEHLKQGPMMAKVDDIEVSWDEYNGQYKEFNISY
jgi:acylphosphatase